MHQSPAQLQRSFSSSSWYFPACRSSAVACLRGSHHEVHHERLPCSMRLGSAGNGPNVMCMGLSACMLGFHSARAILLQAAQSGSVRVLKMCRRGTQPHAAVHVSWAIIAAIFAELKLGGTRPACGRKVVPYATHRGALHPVPRNPYGNLHSFSIQFILLGLIHETSQNGSCNGMVHHNSGYVGHEGKHRGALSPTLDLRLGLWNHSGEPTAHQ